MGGWFTRSGPTLCWLMIGYGFVASVLPVWMLLCPRDYLSTFLKITTILALAAGILLIRPSLQMPALTPFALAGEGPVFAGKLFPFVFITIACGAISGFHGLVASGTTPKMISRESDARFIGYGGMLMESMVGVMAPRRCTLHPGSTSHDRRQAPTSALPACNACFVVHSEHMRPWRASWRANARVAIGGAPSLAVAWRIFSSYRALSAAYREALGTLRHLFEALFILTTSTPARVSASSAQRSRPRCRVRTTPGCPRF